MTTWCRQIRAALNAGEATRDDPAVAEHLVVCADCSRFAHRLQAFRDAWPAGGGSAASFAARLRGRSTTSTWRRAARATIRLLVWAVVVGAVVAAAVAVHRGAGSTP